MYTQDQLKEKLADLGDLREVAKDIQAKTGLKTSFAMLSAMKGGSRKISAIIELYIVMREDIENVRIALGDASLTILSYIDTLYPEEARKYPAIKAQYNKEIESFQTFKSISEGEAPWLN